MKITIEFIPHLEQRYNTCGDWVFDADGNLNMKVSILEDTGLHGSYLIAIHELIEALLCQAHGITTEMVDKFDLAYDATKDVEPGDDPDCPCRDEHCVATGIERLLAPQFDVWWTPYENEIIELTEVYALREKETKRE